MLWLIIVKLHAINSTKFTLPESILLINLIYDDNMKITNNGTLTVDLCRFPDTL
jgi:hypothetical protein